MPSFTTTKRSPAVACRRRAKTSGQRSSPFNVDAVPSVIESPNATITRVVRGAVIWSWSRKYQDADDIGNADSPSSPPCAPASGAVMYDVVSALACHVIGPLSPTTWKLTASLRPFNIGSAAFFTNGSDTASESTSLPGATVTVFLPPNVIATTAAGQHRAAAVLQTDVRAVEGDGLRAERVGQANARLFAPDIGPHDHAERLVDRAARGVRESELELGLSGRIAEPGKGRAPTRPTRRPSALSPRARRRPAVT